MQIIPPATYVAICLGSIYALDTDSPSISDSPSETGLLFTQITRTPYIPDATLPLDENIRRHHAALLEYMNAHQIPPTAQPDWKLAVELGAKFTREALHSILEIDEYVRDTTAMTWDEFEVKYKDITGMDLVGLPKLRQLGVSADQIVDCLKMAFDDMMEAILEHSFSLQMEGLQKLLDTINMVHGMNFQSPTTIATATTT